MRRRLSNRLFITKSFILIGSLIVLPYCFYNFPDVREFCLLGEIPLIIAGYFIFYLPDNIYFDSDNIYITHFSNSIVVGLEQITSVEFSVFGTFTIQLVRIKYMLNNEEHVARFYLRYFSIYFNDFSKLVKLKNPKVEIDNPFGSFF